MKARDSLEWLWQQAASATSAFTEEAVRGLSPPVQRYLRHALSPGAPIAAAVRLWMHGEIRLRGWCPFSAEQVIRADGQMVWLARVRMGRMIVKGYDRLMNGTGELDWRLFGLFPVMRARNPDVTRSALGRAVGERVWLPTALLGADWSAAEPNMVVARLRLQEESMALTLRLNDQGAPQALSLPRWGDPDGRGYRWETFGGEVFEERTFQGITIPTRLTVGWYFGEARYRSAGEFFRCCIDRAVFR